MKDFTIGYIDHSQDAHSKYLGPCLAALMGEFEVDSTSAEQCPAVNYNIMIERCVTPYLILTHQDVTFSPDLLHCIADTMHAVPDFGALGMVGVDSNRKYIWSRPDKPGQVETLDCCFIVIRRELGVHFDAATFDGLHQYVEDYCGQISRGLGKPIYTILSFAAGLYPGETHSGKISGNSYLAHHGYTFSQRGACWGDWRKYNQRLQLKWPGIKVT